MGCGISSSETCVSVIPTKICLELIKDADTVFEFTLTDGRSEPVDITNDSVRLTVKESIGGTSKITKTNTTGQHSDPTSGKTRFKITKTDIVDVLTDESTVWIYEVRRIQQGGDEAVHVMGDFVVHLSIGG